MTDQDFEDGLKSLIPDYMHEGLRNYYYHGGEPGHFLQAILKNDFMQACGRADGTNLSLLANYGKFLYNHMPEGSYGSLEKYTAWIMKHRPVCGMYGSLVKDGSCRNCGHPKLSHSHPGSDEAISGGCICPVMDNAHGEGRNGKWITDTKCPLHKNGYRMSSPLTDRQKHEQQAL